VQRHGGAPKEAGSGAESWWRWDSKTFSEKKRALPKGLEGGGGGHAILSPTSPISSRSKADKKKNASSAHVRGENMRGMSVTDSGTLVGLTQRESRHRNKTS